MERRPIRAIISGGGTGGHIFPALSIAGRLRAENPSTEVLFVGAEGKMEMEKVPAAGYEIVGLPVAGLQRRLSLSNLALPFKVFRSVRMAGRIIDEFRPDVAVGVGGYASAPLLWAAQRKGIPTVIQEQNGFAGLANRVLGKRAERICTAYEGMERFFPAERIVLTGNPIRDSIRPSDPRVRQEAVEFYGLNHRKKHILVIGGSLGSRTLNESVMGWIKEGCPGGGDVEVMWQCGRYYKESVDSFMNGGAASVPGVASGGFTAGAAADGKVVYSDFISRMDLAYAAADVVVSRSGASSVSELCAAGKAVVFVPSPNVTEDHQTHNAMALVRRDAALIVKDGEAAEKLFPTALELVHDPARVALLQENIALCAHKDAAGAIVDEIYSVLG